ncbi:hypothetical protein HK100_006850, partial [Physocladia obscura]
MKQSKKLVKITHVSHKVVQKHIPMNSLYIAVKTLNITKGNYLVFTIFCTKVIEENSTEKAGDTPPPSVNDLEAEITETGEALVTHALMELCKNCNSLIEIDVDT